MDDHFCKIMVSTVFVASPFLHKLDCECLVSLFFVAPIFEFLSGFIYDYGQKIR